MQTGFGASKNKFSPYLVIHFSKTENITSGLAPTPPEYTLTSTCSNYSSFLFMPMTDPYIPNVFTGDGNSKYLGFEFRQYYYFGDGINFTTQWSPSYFRFVYSKGPPTNSLTSTASGEFQFIGGRPCWWMGYNVGISMYDKCYDAVNPNNRFWLGKNNFTYEVDVRIFQTSPILEYQYTACTFITENQSRFQVSRFYDKRLFATFVLNDTYYSMTTTYTLTTSHWYTISFCRNGNAFKLLVDQEIVKVTSASGSFADSTIGAYGVRIGSSNTEGPFYRGAGWMANFKAFFRESLY